MKKLYALKFSISFRAATGGNTSKTKELPGFGGIEAVGVRQQQHGNNVAAIAVAVLSV